MFFDGAQWIQVGVDGTRTIVKAHLPLKPLRDQRERIYKRDGYRCVWCLTTENLSLDHIIPLADGGRATDANLQVLCVPCNADKGQGPNVITDTALRRREQNAKKLATKE